MDGEGAGLRERSVQDRTESRELCKMDTHRSKRNFVLPPQPLDGGPAHPELERCLPKREVCHAFELLFRDFHATARVGGGAELMKSVVSIIPVTGSPGPGPGLLERQRQAGGLPVVHSRWTAVSDSRSPEAWHRTLLEDLVASILLHCPKPKVRLFSPGCRLFFVVKGRICKGWGGLSLVSYGKYKLPCGREWVVSKKEKGNSSLRSAQDRHEPANGVNWKRSLHHHSS